MRMWHIYYGPWDWHERNLYFPKEMVRAWGKAGHRANMVNTDLISLAQDIKKADAKCDVAFIHDWQTVEAAERVGLDIVGRSKFRVLIVGGGWRRPHWVKKSLKAVKDMRVHLVCLTQRVHYNKFKEVHSKVFHIGLGFSPEVFYPDWEAEKKDIVFCGDDGSGRARRLELLKKAFPQRTNFVTGGILTHKEMAAMMRVGAIGWNQIDKGPGEHGIAENLRIYELAGSGLFQLCGYSKHHPFKDKDGIHYVSWKNDNEMVKKARYYLDHPDEREEIARAGWEESKRHTWAHRAREYKQLVEAHL